MQDNTHFRLMAQAVGDQAKLRRLKEQEERMSEEPEPAAEPNSEASADMLTDISIAVSEINQTLKQMAKAQQQYGLMAALAETNEHLKQMTEVVSVLASK